MSGAESASIALGFPDLFHRFDAGQAAAQIARMATDIGCAVECVGRVLRELTAVPALRDSLYVRLAPHMK